jgi:hypothetical protein
LQQCPSLPPKTIKNCQVSQKYPYEFEKKKKEKKELKKKKNSLTKRRRQLFLNITVRIIKYSKI